MSATPAGARPGRKQTGVLDRPASYAAAAAQDPQDEGFFGKPAFVLMPGAVFAPFISGIEPDGVTPGGHGGPIDLAVKDGQLTQWSHMLGVRPEGRGAGIGVGRGQRW